MLTAVLPGGYLDLVQTGLDAALPPAATFQNAPNRTAFYFATDTNILYRYNPATNLWDATQPKSQLVGPALTAKAIAGITYLLNTAAGSVLTLPAATGSGLNITVAVSVSATSNAHKILTSPITDKLVGNASGGTVTTHAALQFFGNVANAFHSLQMPFAGTQPSGGIEGDLFSLTDIAAGVWLVEAMFQSGTTPTTPFSTATT